MFFVNVCVLKLNFVQVGRIRDFEDVSKLAKADQYFSEVCIFSRLKWTILTTRR